MNRRRERRENKNSLITSKSFAIERRSRMEKRLGILHLEDNLKDAELTQATLEAHGMVCAISRVVTRAEFVAALEDDGFDLIFADYSLPQFDGVSAVAIARARRPELPVILISGTLGEERAIEALRLGATDYVLKQNLARLIPVVRRALAEKEEQRQRRQAEQKYRDIVDHAVEGIFQTTSEGRYINANPALARMMGYDSPETLMKMVTHIPRQLYVDVTKRAELGCMLEEQEIVRDFEFEVYRKDGVKIWLSVNSRVVRDTAGEVLYYEGFAQNITRRKHAEIELRRSYDHLEVEVANRPSELRDANLRLQNLDRIKSEFLANMSHELRTRLNCIIGFTQLMHDRKVGPIATDQKEYLGDILTSSQHLLQLINDLLDNAKIESGRMEVLVTPFPVTGVIHELTQNLAPIMSTKGLKLIRDIPDDLPPITTDRRKLLQILLNLASNAVKFTEWGEIRFQCRATSEALQIAVSDTGIGINAKDMDLLFQPFSQIDSGLQKRQQGTGLGLHLSQNLARLLDGVISVESEYGKGSTFTLTLPLAAEAKMV